MDAQTHAHLQTLDPIQRADYLSKLHKRNLLFRQQQQGEYSISTFDQLNLCPIFVQINQFLEYLRYFSGFIQQGNAVAGQQRPPNHIIARPQVPGAQMQWMQQQVHFFF